MQGRAGFKKVTRAEFERLARDQQIAYLKKASQIHLANQNRMQAALNEPPHLEPKPLIAQPASSPEPNLAGFVDQKQSRKKSRRLSRLANIKSRKIAMVASVAVIVLGTGIFTANLIRNLVLGKDADQAIMAFLDHEKPLAVRQNGRFGFMNIHGQMIIDPKYTWAGEFYGDFVEVKTETEHLMINRKGETALTLDIGAVVNIDTRYGVWFIGDKMYDVNLKLLNDDTKPSLTYKQKGIYTYKNESGNIVISSLKNQSSDIYTCQSACSVSVSNAPDFVPDTYIIVNETAGETSHNKIFNAQTKAEVFSSQNQLLVVKDKNQVAKSVNGNEELMYLTGDKVAYSSADNFEVYDQIKHVVKVSNADEKTAAQYPFAYINTDTDETTYLAPVMGSTLTAFDQSLDVQTCGKNGIGIGKNGGAIKCDWLSLTTPSMNVMEYLKSQRRLIIVGRTAAGQEFYNVRTDERYDQFEHISISSSNDELFVMTKSEGQWFVYSLVSGKYVSIPNVLMNSFTNLPNGIKVYPSYFTVETKTSMTYYNHDMDSFYEVAK